MSGYLQKPGGGSSGGNPSSPLNGLQYNSGGVFGADSLATRDPITNYTDISRNFDSVQTEYTADLANIIILGSISGPFTIGETINDLTSGATGTLEFIGNPGGDLFFLSGVTGTFSGGDNIQGATSGETATVGIDFPISFSIGQTIYFFDTLTNASTGSGVVTNLVGLTISFTISSGTVANNYAILDTPGGPSTVAGLINLTSAPITTSMTTGFITDNNFAGAGLEGTYMHIVNDNTNEAIDFGVFDLSPFGGLRTTAGIVSLDQLSGASTTFIVNPAISDGGISMSNQSTTGDRVDFTLGNGAFSLLSDTTGFGKYGFGSSGFNAYYRANGTTVVLPDSTPNVNDVLTVTSVGGSNVTTSWVAGGGSGSSSGPQYSIQFSDGIGGFSSTSNFLWNNNLNILTVQGNNGFYINGADNPGGNQFYYFGNFQNDGNTAYWYTDTQSNDNQSFYTNTVHSISTPDFVGNGVDNFYTTGTPTGNTTSYTLTIDSTLQYGGDMFSGTGLNDASFSGGYSGTGNNKYKIVIDSTPVFSGVTFTGAGLDDITTAVSPYFSGPLPTTYTLTVTENNVKLLNYDTLVGGTFSDGDTITGLTSSTVATIIYQAGGALYYQVTSGTDFSVSETIDNGLGVTANVTSVAGIDADVFEWTDGVVTNKQWMLPSFYMTLNYGVSVTFASTTGHTIGNSWTFDFTAPTTDTFEWFLNGASQASGVAITGAAQSLVDGISVTFASTSGHTFGDFWDKIVGFGYMEYATTAETGGNMQIGEYVTGSISGATAIVGFSESGYYHTISLTNQSGIFVTGDILTGGTSGNTATITNYSMTGVGDTFTWTNGLTTQGQNPISTTFGIQMSNNVVANFNTNTGHDVGDYWTFTMTAQTNQKFKIAGNSIQIGDVDGVFNYDRLNIEVTSGINRMGSSDSFTFHNAYPMQGDRPLLAINSGTTNTVGIGDFNGSHEGFYALFDMPGKTFKMFQGGTGGYERVLLDSGNNYYKFGVPGNGESYFIIDGPNNNTAIHTTGQVTIGDVLEIGNKTQQTINDATQIIKTKSGGNDRTTMVGAPKSLTDNTATQVFKVSLPAGTATGGFFTANVTANDGTDYQAHSDHVTYAAVNKGGTYTTTIQNSNADDAIAVSAGTLTVTWSITTGTDEIFIECTANSSLTTPTIELFYNVISNGKGTVTPL